MRIHLSPQYRKDRSLSVTKAGDTLTINGEVFDFSTLPDGGTIKHQDIPSEWFVEDVSRDSGELRVTLLLPHGPAPEPWQAFPDPITVEADGEIDLPYDTYCTVETVDVEGGRKITTTVFRWHQEPEVQNEFVPDPEEVANVDA